MNLFATRYRGLATIGALLALAVAAIVGTSWASGWMSFGPPHPQSASYEAILRWLVLNDVADQPLDYQQNLVRRLELELQSGFDVSTEIELSAAQQATLENNAATLKFVWFVDSVQQYDMQSVDQRADFMDVRVATVVAWAELARSVGGQRSGDEGFTDEIQRWVRNEQDAILKSQMEQAVHDGVVRWLAVYSLEDQSMTVRTELAERITEQLEAGLDVTDLHPPADTEAAQLRQNSELLMEAWLLHQAARYDLLDADEQPAFITEQIDNVTNWRVLELFADAEDDKSQQQGAMKLMTLSRTWIERAPPNQQSRLRQLLAAVQSHMLLRILNGNS